MENRPGRRFKVQRTTVNIAKRGDYLYNHSGGSKVFTENAVAVHLVAAEKHRPVFLRRNNGKRLQCQSLIIVVRRFLKTVGFKSPPYVK